MKPTLKAFGNDTAGATAIEYGLIAGLVSLSMIVALSSTGFNLGGYYTWLVDKISTALAS